MAVTAGIALEANVAVVNNAVIAEVEAVESAAADSEALPEDRPCLLLPKWTTKRISQLWVNPMRY